MRNTLTRLLALSLLAATLPACASRLVEVEIVDRDSGSSLTTYSHRGRAYVAGVPGQRYAVRLINRTGERVLAVLSVDGVNAVSGETASPNQNGYVLDPYESAEIAGWRKSQDDVAQFYFTRLPDSYAARTDRPENVGVIGVAAFRERARPQPMPDVRFESRRSAESAPGNAPAPSARAGASGKAMAPDSYIGESRERLGTGHGERQYAPIEHTTFERASRSPAQVVAIRYDSPANLAAMGVLPRHVPTRPSGPQPFPGQYVPDPYY